MKKFFTILLALTMTMTVAGCSDEKSDENVADKTTTESSSKVASANGEEDENQTTTNIESSEEAETTEQETTTSGMSELESTDESTEKSTETTTQKATEKPTGKPAETTTQKATEKPTEAPTEAPIVTKIGNVDDATYKKAVSAFESIVKKLRADGLVKSSDVCVTMDSAVVKVDITFGDGQNDIELRKDNSTNIYTLTFDYDFMWIEGFGETINGKDPALYNKELLIAILSMVSDEEVTLFNRIDLDCFSAAGLYSDKWTEIGDCFIMSGGMEVDKYISYKITKEAVDTRDKAYTLTATTSNGKTVECIIEYDSSKVAYEIRDNDAYISETYDLTGYKVTYMHTVNETLTGPYCYPAIRIGCNSYESYKKMMLDKFKSTGDSNASISEYNSHSVNGYTYYWIEGFYKTETNIGDPDIVYVQIGENEYIELYNVMFEERFEDFINGSFYIKEIKIK